MRDYLTLLRCGQWIKNVFVFAPLVFAGRFLDPAALVLAGAAFALFCLASSATYVFNDLLDVERDRAHPLKRERRPLAAGRLSRRAAISVFSLLIAVTAAGLLWLPEVAPAILTYLLLNAAYSTHLKHWVIWDLFSIAAGFVLRVWSGALAIGVPVSSWMFVTTLSLAVFLAAGKRLQELAGAGSEAREVLTLYSAELLERFAEMAATGALVFYSLFVVTTRPELVLTVPIVLFGLFRYWYLMKREGLGESPGDALLRDPQLAATVVVWGLACLYGLRGSVVSA